jgi:hypothetical protein
VLAASTSSGEMIEMEFVTLHDKCDTFLHDICDVRDICTSCICMVSAEQKWLDFGYFFDLSGTSSRRLVLAASTSSGEMIEMEFMPRTRSISVWMLRAFWML